MNVSSPFQRFNRQEWSALSAGQSLPLTDEDIRSLRGLCDRLSLDEVARMYLPLSRLLKLRFEAGQHLFLAQNAFLNRENERSPFVIAISGSVAVGKSTFARTLQALLTRWPGHPNVSLVTTDGFLYPNAVLEERDLMRRKGFPESYDLRGCSGSSTASNPVTRRFLRPSTLTSATTSCRIRFRSWSSRTS
jgi:type I pantothenate kinase